IVVHRHDHDRAIGLVRDGPQAVERVVQKVVELSHRDARAGQVRDRNGKPRGDQSDNTSRDDFADRTLSSNGEGNAHASARHYRLRKQAQERKVTGLWEGGTPAKPQPLRKSRLGWSLALPFQNAVTTAKRAGSTRRSAPRRTAAGFRRSDGLRPWNRGRTD